MSVIKCIILHFSLQNMMKLVFVFVLDIYRNVPMAIGMRLGNYYLKHIS